MLKTCLLALCYLASLSSATLFEHLSKKFSRKVQPASLSRKKDPTWSAIVADSTQRTAEKLEKLKEQSKVSVEPETPCPSNMIFRIDNLSKLYDDEQYGTLDEESGNIKNEIEKNQSKMVACRTILEKHLNRISNGREVKCIMVVTTELKPILKELIDPFSKESLVELGKKYANFKAQIALLTFSDNPMCFKVAYFIGFLEDLKGNGGINSLKEKLSSSCVEKCNAFLNRFPEGEASLPEMSDSETLKKKKTNMTDLLSEVEALCVNGLSKETDDLRQKVKGRHSQLQAMLETASLDLNKNLMGELKSFDGRADEVEGNELDKFAKEFKAWKTRNQEFIDSNTVAFIEADRIGDKISDKELSNFSAPAEHASVNTLKPISNRIRGFVADEANCIKAWKELIGRYPELLVQLLGIENPENFREASNGVSRLSDKLDVVNESCKQFASLPQARSANSKRDQLNGMVHRNSLVYEKGIGSMDYKEKLAGDIAFFQSRMHDVEKSSEKASELEILIKEFMGWWKAVGEHIKQTPELANHVEAIAKWIKAKKDAQVL